ncbi:hypothetical protein [Ferrimonas balearica]|uniref:hypothetical protein n=1 Tax=Ferrimonas balearica TaxID=44012 RepID=UPI001C99A2E6|nr:hypothetical protein [Ferrimonas balearica]MBY5992523.1 hypothetical protein [Ferrimonas balearica]
MFEFDTGSLRKSEAGIFAQNANAKQWGSLLSEFSQINERRALAGLKSVKTESIADIMSICTLALEARGTTIEEVRLHQRKVVRWKQRLAEEGITLDEMRDL